MKRTRRCLKSQHTRKEQTEEEYQVSGGGGSGARESVCDETSAGQREEDLCRPHLRGFIKDQQVLPLPLPLLMLMLRAFLEDTLPVVLSKYSQKFLRFKQLHRRTAFKTDPGGHVSQRRAVPATLTWSPAALPATTTQRPSGVATASLSRHLPPSILFFTPEKRTKSHTGLHPDLWTSVRPVVTDQRRRTDKLIYLCCRFPSSGFCSSSS